MRKFIGFLLSVILFSSILPAFAAEGYFEDFDRQLYRQPTVCIFEPNDIDLSDSTWATWYKESKKGIDEWENRMKTTLGAGNWDINLVEVPKEKLEFLNPSGCDIDIRFLDSEHFGPDSNSFNGWYDSSTKSIEIIRNQMTYCGKFLWEPYGIFLDKYCRGDDLERGKKLAATVKHEFGHAFGLGHYVSDNREWMQDWYANPLGAPSIMAAAPSNEDVRQITQNDIERVSEIHGYYGFGKEKNPDPVFIYPEKIITEPEISDIQNIQVKPYQTSSTKITGYIPEKLYTRGTPVEFKVTKPDGTKESFATMVSSHQYFEYPMIFGSSSLTGTYEILVIYKGEFVQKNAINLSKSITSNNIQKSTLPSTNVASGKYLEKISIISDNNEYHVKSFLGKASTSSIRVTAENECPMKKQVFQKDFVSRSGTEVSFSFFQLRDGKPDTCSIHFSITDFNGNELDSLKVDYKVQATKKQLTQTEQSTQTGKLFEYKKETLTLQKNTEQKISSLKSGISSAEKSLKSTNYKKSEAKEEVKKAWDSISWAKKYLGNAEYTQKEGKNFISKSDFKSAYYKYKYSFDSAKKIEPYLFDITKYLNNAKKLEK